MLASTNDDRKQMGLADYRLGNGWCMFNAGNEPDMGHKNTIDVAGERSRFG